ncbi:hypothetical protein [Gallaecimonas mangrovi]|uniref:hypothetical protein n=1 Tax=Gallaecimonas mangrovi TaxID=2291597 RepID=UPI000E20878D|nr:hypothetical protein [Gallaecimonas mangrovi]
MRLQETEDQALLNQALDNRQKLLEAMMALRDGNEAVVAQVARQILNDDAPVVDKLEVERQRLARQRLSQNKASNAVNRYHRVASNKG